MKCSTCDHANSPDAIACLSCGSPMHPAGTNGTGAAVPYSPSLPANTRLQNGLFAVREVLGQGGFGITYRGGDLRLRRLVAVKEFFPHGALRQGTTVNPPSGVTDEVFAQSRKGFVQEAMTLARFEHPGIVRVLGVFEENNTAYMVMELLAGQTLQQRLDKEGVLSEKDAVRIITQISEALAAVHETKLLHRDIKPDNIILVAEGTPQERAVLIDFGTAREFAANKTHTMTAMVTHGYAPLEQYGKQAKFGPYTDIYALGATLYHCLTGSLPVSAMDRLNGVDLLPPDQVNPNVSRGVSEAIMSALQVKATDRPQTAVEWIQALANPKGAVPSSTAIPVPPPLDLLPVSVPQHTTAHRLCPHCGAAMIPSATICQFCNKRSDAPPDQDLPGYSKSYERFDKIMDAIPWGLIFIALFIVLAGRIGLAVFRYQNGSRDFGETLVTEVKKSPEAAHLRNVSLELGEGTYDRENMTKHYNDYVGQVRYRDGDAGTIRLNVTERDWYYRPEKFKFSVAPTDFGGQIAGSIRAEMNKRLTDNESTMRVTKMSLSRVTRTEYTGTFIVDNRHRYSQGISVNVYTFAEDGSPATWNYVIH